MQAKLFLFLLGILSIKTVNPLPDISIPCSDDYFCQQRLGNSPTIKCINGICLCLNSEKTALELCSRRDLILGAKPMVVANGEECASDENCIEGAKCLKAESGNATRCDCEPHSVLSSDKHRCLREAHEPGDKCVESIQCTQSLGGAECSAMDHVCRCRPSFHFASTVKRCIKNKKLGEACTREEESCYEVVDPPGKNALGCSSKGYCKCMKNFYEHDGRCHRSGASRAVNLISLLLVLVVSSVKLL